MSGLYKGVVGTFKNIYCKANGIDRESVVLMVVNSNGTTVELTHCGEPNKIRDKKHKLRKAILVKPKKDGFAVEIICLRTHHHDFESLEVFLEARLRGSSEKVRSETFTVIGSRDETRTKEYADKKALETNTKSNSSSTNSNHLDPRANPPPTTSSESDFEEELSALLKFSADPSKQVQAESDQDYQNISTSTILEEDPYEHFTHSGFDN